MKIKIAFLVLTLFVSISHAQTDSLSQEFNVLEHAKQIDRALMEQDSLTLTTLLHDDLTLGHSNGWMETKPGLLETLVQGGVLYESIRIKGSPAFHFQSDNLVTTRRDLDVEGFVNEIPFNVKLNVLEVWILKDSNWLLLARQSVNRKEK